MYYRTRYPKNWKQISLDIRERRAGNRCEWCGVGNGLIGARDIDGVWFTKQQLDTCFHEDAGPLRFALWYPRVIRIVLMVAHLGVPYPDGRPGDKHDKSDCRPENLAALCQRCHLNYDRPDHMARAAATRERKRREREAARGWQQLEMEVG